MPSTTITAVRLRADLVEKLGASGVLPGRLLDTFSLLPRHWFMPQVIWAPLGGEPYHRFDRARDPEGWMRAAYQDSYAVVRWEPGTGSEPDSRTQVTSSVPRPHAVARLLTDLELEYGHRVLELGGGTGWTAALISQHLPDSRVTSVEVDAALSEQAEVNTTKGGREYLRVANVVGDGAEGWPGRAPYDRVVSGYAVSSVPAAWVDQTAPGGIIVTPWCTSWGAWGTLKARVAADRSAEGRFAGHGSFLPERRELRHDPVLPRADAGEPCGSGLDIWSVLRDDDERFVMGARLRDVAFLREQPDAGSPVARVWLHTADWESWVRFDLDGAGQAGAQVRRFGPRGLLREVESVHQWFEARNRPGLERFGLTITPEGKQSMWFDDPRSAVFARVGGARS
ncbi:hypothetical protein [Streptacidiphilus sp. P02-A3a]|uniref:hypothetical protein n=1 Tax=Streptacidiphilus sp. P02-A3a TaxID=2704468 RepID=UPI0015FBAC83|nr:hypothetical protein [Streptacidiphilus sp. P02-A3a]QMU70248.1 hypothetical protein GXP74_20525 [Streptacidiphilus sp. P02-A3a]QMU70296.1 hypothetical protein GXP74_20850 [Streptacidiphilus sp. P02-A3a]